MVVIGFSILGQYSLYCLAMQNSCQSCLDFIRLVEEVAVSHTVDGAISVKWLSIAEAGEQASAGANAMSDKLTHSVARRGCCRVVAWWTIAFAFVEGKLNGVRGKTGTADPFWLSDWLAVGLPWSTAELLGTVLYEHPVVAPQVAHLRQVPLRASVKLPHSAQESPV
jgi:hypothetical protein